MGGFACPLLIEQLQVLVVLGVTESKGSMLSAVSCLAVEPRSLSVATVTCGCMMEVSTRPSQLSSRDVKLESECKSPALQAVGVNGVSSTA